MTVNPHYSDGRPGAAVLQSINDEAAAFSNAEAEAADVRQFIGVLLRIRLRLIADMGKRLSTIVVEGQIQKESS